MARPQLALAAAGGLFFISGAAGLVYEVLWFKRLGQVWGSSALAAASVLVSFLLGLGIGAWGAGRFADRLTRPVRAYGLFEIAIGLLAALVPLELRVLEAAAAALHPTLSGFPLLGALLRCALTFLVLGPPCALMGGTLPLLVRRFAGGDGSLRGALGLLYALNTLGAAAGAALAGFVLLPAAGLAATGWIAVATNIAVGGAAIAASRWGGEGTADAPTAAPAGACPDVLPGEMRGRGGAFRLLAAAFASGGAALALQIGWTRQLSLVLGGSTYAFSAMLTVVLVGIGLGSLAFHGAFRRRGELLRLQAWTALGLVAAAAVGSLSLDGLARLAGTTRHLRADATWNALLACGAASALELIPCFAMGLLLPIYAAAHGAARQAGRAAGEVYAWNTVGTIAGALGAALWVLPAWGAAVTVAAALGVYLVTALWLHPMQGVAGKAESLGIAAVGTALVLLAARGPDTLLSHLGLYLYGDVDLGVETRPPRLLYARDGASTSVAVTLHPDDTLSLRINGKVDASSTGDMPMQLGLAYLPRFLRPEARDVLVIGLGSGTTAGASLLFPETRVTCVELEPAVRAAAELFAAVNHEPFRSDRFRLLFQDGRSHIHGATETYDLILSEPSNPWIAGVSSLFTLEFYRLARARLAPGGVLAQWIQAYSLRPSDYALIVRTIRHVFPHGALLRMSSGDTVLVASERSLDPDAAALDRAQALVDASAPVRQDLEKHFAAADVRSLLLSRRLLADDGLDRFTALAGGEGLHTDSNLRLELDAPLLLFDRRLSALDVERKILAAAEATDFAGDWQRWGCTTRQVPALRSLVDFFAEREAWASADRLLEHGLSIAPEEPYFLAARFMSQPIEDDEGWDEGFERVLAASPEEAGRVGIWLHLQKRYDRAARAWRRLLKSSPQAATLWVNLATTLEAAGAGEEARAALEEARKLDPFSAFVRSQAEALRPGVGASGDSGVGASGAGGVR